MDIYLTPNRIASICTKFKDIGLKDKLIRMWGSKFTVTSLNTFFGTIMT